MMGSDVRRVTWGEVYLLKGVLSEPMSWYLKPIEWEEKTVREKAGVGSPGGVVLSAVSGNQPFPLPKQV